MAEGVDIDRPVVKWGNSYGIRLTQAELRRLGIRPGQRVRGRLTSDTVANHLDEVRFLRLALPTDKEAIDRILDRDLQEDHGAGDE